VHFSFWWQGRLHRKAPGMLSVIKMYMKISAGLLAFANATTLKLIQWRKPHLEKVIELILCMPYLFGSKAFG
jgi:hypothetical protein